MTSSPRVKWLAILLSVVILLGVSIVIGVTLFRSHAEEKKTPTPVDVEDAAKDSTPSSASTTSGDAGATIYATVGMHVEQAGGGNNPDYVNDADRFWQDRGLLLQFATMLKEEGVSFDFMSDTTFLQAVAKFDKNQSDTDGKNIIQYLHEDLGVSIDPHAHESDHSYADVAYLIEQLGVTPTGVVGGFIVSEGTQKYHEPIQGRLYPSYSWTPTILWGGGTANHVGQSEYWTSGIWRPSVASFQTDDPTSDLPDIGTYTSDWDGLDDLLQKRADGQLKAGEIYTITIMSNLRDIQTSGFVDDFKKEIEARKSAQTSGEIKWMTLPATIDVWKSQYHSEPNQLFYSGSATTENPFAGGSSGGKVPSGSGSFSGGKGSGSCGDGICQTIEQQRGLCSEDCSGQ